MNCSNCGKELSDEALFCDKCGSKVEMEVFAEFEKKDGPLFCIKCGSNLEENALFCKMCGAKIDGTETKEKESIEEKELGEEKVTDGKKLIRKVGIVALVIIALVFVFSIGECGKRSKKVDFRDLYNKYCVSSWAECPTDNSYLKIDTNPYDYDDEGIYYIEAYYAIEKINKDLGLPESLNSEIDNTTWDHGKQTKKFDNLVISWTYHPDKGLELMYSYQ